MLHLNKLQHRVYRILIDTSQKGVRKNIKLIKYLCYDLISSYGLSNYIIFDKKHSFIDKHSYTVLVFNTLYINKTKYTFIRFMTIYSIGSRPYTRYSSDIQENHSCCTNFRNYHILFYTPCRDCSTKRINPCMFTYVKNRESNSLHFLVFFYCLSSAYSLSFLQKGKGYFSYYYFT